MSPFVEVSVGVGVFHDWILPGSINTSDLVTGADLSLAKDLFCEISPYGVEIGVIHVALTNEGSQEIRGDVLQNIELGKEISPYFESRTE